MNKAIYGFEHVYKDKKSPKTLLLLHGTGGKEHDLIPLGEDLDPDANILSPRGNVLENGMPRFFKRLSQGVFDREDLKLRSEELAGFILESSKTYGFAQDGVIAVGYSNGANIALHLMASNPHSLSKGILLRPMSASLPDSVADLSSVRMLVISGLMDPLVSSEDLDRLEQIVTDHGAHIDIKMIPASHSLTAQDLTHAKAWLKTTSSL
jgi:predicted esterase